MTITWKKIGALIKMLAIAYVISASVVMLLASVLTGVWWVDRTLTDYIGPIYAFLFDISLVITFFLFIKIVVDNPEKLK